MPGASVLTIPFQGSVAATTDGLNGPLSPYGTAINNQNHDPGDATSGYGSSIPLWGPANALYAGTQNHGPGATGTDWNTAYNGSAAIPADPQETAIAPVGAITAAHGAAVELQRMRGTINVLLGRPATTNWGASQPPASVSLIHLNPVTADAGALYVTGVIETDGQLQSNVAAGTPPLVVTSTTTVPNLSADAVDGHGATASYGTGQTGLLLALNANGRYDQNAIDYDATEAATFDALGTGSTQQNNLNRLRYAVQQIVSAAAGQTTPWYQTPGALVGSISTTGGVAQSGAVTFQAGSGIMLDQPAPGVIEITAAPGGISNQGMTYADLYGTANTVVSGLTPTWASAPTVAPTLVTATGASTTAPTVYVTYTWIGPGGYETLPSPEANHVMASTLRQLQITIPAFPAGVTGANIYVSVTASGTETRFLANQTTTGPFIFTPGVSVLTATAQPVTALGTVLQTGTAYISGSRATLNTNVNMLLAASSDNYIDWDGTNLVSGVHITPVGVGAAAPAIYANSIRLGYVTTSATAPTTFADLRQFIVSPANQAKVPTDVFVPYLESGGAVTAGVGAAVTIAAASGWFSANGKITQSVGGTVSGLANGQWGIYWDGSVYSSLSLASAATAMPRQTGKLALARVFVASGAISAVYDVRQFHTRPPTPLSLRLEDFGADPTGVADSSPALQACINIASVGDGTTKIEAGSGYFVFMQQIDQPAWFATNFTTATRGVHLVGGPSSYQLRRLTGGTIFDMRWDGGIGNATPPSNTTGYYQGYQFSTSGNRTPVDYAVVTGLNVVWTSGSPAFSITTGGQDAHRAYIASGGTTLYNLGTSTIACSLAGIPTTSGGGTTIAAGQVDKWHIDVDALGNVYVTRAGQWTDTRAGAPASAAYNVYKLSGTGATLQTFGQSANPNTVRIGAFYTDGSGNPVDFMGLRPVVGKLDLKGFSTWTIEGITFIRQSKGNYDSAVAYSAGDWVQQGFRTFRALQASTNKSPAFNIGTYWAMETAFVDQVPFLRTTTARLYIYNCLFIGPVAASAGILPGMDAIHLGGPGSPYIGGSYGDRIYGGAETITSTGAYLGTGGMISGCYFNNVQNGIVFRNAANQTSVTGNFFEQTCGGGDTDAAINLRGVAPVASAAVNSIVYNQIESTNYVNCIRLAHHARGNWIAGNQILDPWSANVGGTSTTRSTVIVTPGQAGTQVSVNGYVQFAELCAWKGMTAVLGQNAQWYSGSVAAGARGEIVTIGTGAYTGTAIAGAPTVYAQVNPSQIDLTTNLGLAAGASMDVMLGSGTNQEMASLTYSAPNGTGQFRFTTTLYFRLTHLVGEPVTTFPILIPVTGNGANGGTVFPHGGQDNLARSLCAVRVITSRGWNDGAGGVGPTGPTSNQILQSQMSGIMGVYDENANTGTNVVIASGLPWDENKFPSPVRAMAPTQKIASIGTLMVGDAPFNGFTAGYFAGSANGTLIAGNASTGFTGNLLDLQVAGVSQASVTSAGALTGTSLATTGGSVTPAVTAPTNANLPSAYKGTATPYNFFTKTAVTTSADLTMTGTGAQLVYGAFQFQAPAGISNISVGSVLLMLRRDPVNVPAALDTFRVSVYTDTLGTTAGGVPNAVLSTSNPTVTAAGVLLPVGAVTVSGTTYVAYTLQIGPPSLTAGNYYWIVLEGNITTGKVLYAQYDSAAAGNGVATWNGTTWTAQAGQGVMTVTGSAQGGFISVALTGSQTGIVVSAASGVGVSATTVYGVAVSGNSSSNAGGSFTTQSGSGILSTSVYGFTGSFTQNAPASPGLMTPVVRANVQINRNNSLLNGQNYTGQMLLINDQVAVASSTGDFLAIQRASTSIFRVDKNAHLLSVGNAGAANLPTLALANGSTVSSTTLSDTRGIVTITPPAAPVEGTAYATITFGTAYGSVPVVICETIGNVAVKARAVSVAAGNFTIGFFAEKNGTLSNVAYTVHYWVIG